MIIQVALPQPLRKLFDYTLPPTLAHHAIAAGQRVKVPFGKQEIIGVVMGSSFMSEHPLSKLRPISAILDPNPIIPPNLIQFCLWAADYYHHPIGEIIALTLPPLLRKQSGTTHEKKEEYWRTTSEGQVCDPLTLKRSPKQMQALIYLQQQSTGIALHELSQQNFKRDVLLKLQEKALVQQYFMDALSIPHNELTNHEALTLSTEQSFAVNYIKDHLHHFVPFVLDGITGSGKTEVYLQSIYQVLLQAKQALVLVPEIGLTPQTVACFQNRFPYIQIAIFHSNLSDKERYQQWQAVQSGRARIIIGTRSALFTPMPELGIIIIDEAHDASFKQQDGLRYSARDLALKRAQLHNIPIVMGSATHTLETLLQIKKQRFIHLPLTQRTLQAQLPNFQVVDLRKQKNREGLALETQTAIAEHLSAGNQVLLFLNRRGYAPTLLCHDCGWIAGCKRCDARLTVHYDPYQLHCHHCNTMHIAAGKCGNCASINLISMGAGTERIENYIQTLFPTYTTIRIDRDTTRTKQAFDHYLKSIHQGEAQILIGTQMLAKGHHFPNVTLVCILNVDQGLCSPDFRASEQLAQLITQVAGRAGRSAKKGHVILQTHYPDNPLLLTLLTQGYHAFANIALEERQIAQLPPFSVHAVIRGSSPQLELTIEFLQKIRILAENLNLSDFQIIGPMPAVMSKRAGMYRALLLFQSANKITLQNNLKQLIQAMEQQKLRSKVRWHLDIDPIDHL